MKEHSKQTQSQSKNIYERQKTDRERWTGRQKNQSLKHFLISLEGVKKH